MTSDSPSLDLWLALLAAMVWMQRQGDAVYIAQDKEGCTAISLLIGGSRIFAPIHDIQLFQDFSIKNQDWAASKRDEIELVAMTAMENIWKASI